MESTNTIDTAIEGAENHIGRIEGRVSKAIDMVTLLLAVEESREILRSVDEETGKPDMKFYGVRDYERLGFKFRNLNPMEANYMVLMKHIENNSSKDTSNYKSLANELLVAFNSVYNTDPRPKPFTMAEHEAYMAEKRKAA